MDWYMELEFFGRLLLAGICGAVVGYERKSRMKEAGIRTHFIVAMAAALVMMVSKYGFMDVASLPGHSVDVSRVAASVVSGVGFLGAGMIFVRKYTINGLTTAAGIWAISAIGMAIGGGMYILGIMGTLVILFAQVFLHKHWKVLHIPTAEQIRMTIINTEEAVQEVQTLLEKHEIEITNIKMEVEKNGDLSLDIQTRIPGKFNPVDLMTVFRGCSFVKSLEL